SVQEFKTDTLARSALEIVVADLKREIVEGSDATTVGESEVLYFPKSNANMVPVRSGNPEAVDGVDPVPNLVRRSVRNEGDVSPGVGSRASASSSTDPAANGAFISKARWNKHYLIPRHPDVRQPGSESKTD